MYIYIHTPAHSPTTVRRKTRLTARKSDALPKAAEEKRRVCSASKTFHLTFFSAVGGGVDGGFSVEPAPHGTTSINIVLCAKNQPKLRHLSVLKVARAARISQLVAPSLSHRIIPHPLRHPQIEK